MSKSNIYTNGEYLHRNPTWNSQGVDWKAEQILKMLKRHQLDSGRVADVGCGSGKMIEELGGKFSNKSMFYGFEISPDAIRMCNKIKNKNIRFYLDDFVSDKKWKGYDLVLAVDVIEHIENYYEFLRNIRSRGKFKLFYIPLDISARSICMNSSFLIGRKKFGHLHHFSKITAIAALEETGYEVVDSMYAPWSCELPGRSLRMRLMSPFRRILFMINQDLAVRLLGGYSLIVLAR